MTYQQSSEKRLIIDLLKKLKELPQAESSTMENMGSLGNPLKDFIEDVAHKIKENPMGEGTEYNIYPPNLKEPYESRRRKSEGLCMRF